MLITAMDYIFHCYW